MCKSLQVAMLGKHGLTVSEGMLKQLEDAPMVWKQLKKKMFQRCSPTHRQSGIVLTEHLALGVNYPPLVPQRVRSAHSACVQSGQHRR